MPQLNISLPDSVGEGAGQGAGATVAVVSGAPNQWLWASGGTAAPLTQPLPGWRDIFVSAKSPVPMIGGISFPDGAWDPLLKAAAIAAAFAALPGWQGHPFDPGEPDDTEVGLRKDEADLAQKGLDLSQADATRVDEITAQATDFTPYWANLLSCSAASRPATWSLVLIGLQVGGLLATFFKLKYRRARPAQRWPVISPIIPTPAHPSYPSGHTLQSFLIAACVKQAAPSMGTACDVLAERIAINREFAGVHFPSDTAASKRMFEPALGLLLTLPKFQATVETARGEWGEPIAFEAPPLPALPPAAPHLPPLQADNAANPRS